MQAVDWQRWCLLCWFFAGADRETRRFRHCRHAHLRVLRFVPRVVLAFISGPVALACSVSFSLPCLSLLHRLRWLLLGEGWCSPGRPRWILASLCSEVAFVVVDSSLVFSPVNCCCLLEAPFRSPDMFRASSLWLILRIETFFPVLTGTMVRHVLRLDGVSV